MQALVPLRDSRSSLTIATRGSSRRPLEQLLPRDEYDQLAEPFFHATPGAPLDKVTIDMLQRRRRRWVALEVSRRAAELQGEVRLDTTLVQNVTIPVRLSFAWPSVAENETIPFGTVQQGLTGEVRIFTRRIHWDYWLQVRLREGAARCCLRRPSIAFERTAAAFDGLV